MAMSTLFAAFNLLPAVLCWLGEPNPTPANKNGIDAIDDEIALTRGQALGTFSFWTVAGPFALILLVQVGFLVHQLVLLEVRVGREQAGYIIAVTTGMAVLGRVAIGFVIDSLNHRIVASVSMLS